VHFTAHKPPGYRLRLSWSGGTGSTAEKIIQTSFSGLPAGNLSECSAGGQNRTAADPSGFCTDGQVHSPPIVTELFLTDSPHPPL
jgi:hypothetical protein